MGELAREVLSEAFQACMEGRRLRAAMFVTFRFDPAFFEQEVLPVFFDVPLSHAAPVRLVQLEEPLKCLPARLAVYYDAHGLVSGGGGAAKLDIARIPVRLGTGIFHPKNVLALVEEEDEEGVRRQALLVAALSANLTRSGWWENVEVCHIEEIAEGEKNRLKKSLDLFLKHLVRLTPAEESHEALEAIRAFLRGTKQRQQRSSNGRLHTHFYRRKESVPDFLEKVGGGALRDTTRLEIISPYFDKEDSSAPLEELIARFAPKEVRVLLPRASSGEATVSPGLYDHIASLPDVAWGKLPSDLLRLSKQAEAARRFVHAKVYRFFTPRPKREILFVGSANLTGPGHSAGGNLETGFLVEVSPRRRPDFWLELETSVPTEFVPASEEGPAAASGGSRLNLRYHWDRGALESFWDAGGPAPPLRLEARGVELGELPSLPPRQWRFEDQGIADRLREILPETALVEVHGETEEVTQLLVQEEGMQSKPSLLFSLSLADILRYWAILTTEQRTAFLEEKAPGAALSGTYLVTHAPLAASGETLFDRFAGVFHAFGCLEQSVRQGLREGNEREAVYRIFGTNYDTLGRLLERLETDEDDSVNRYVIAMCAKQLARDLARDYPEFWKKHEIQARVLESQLAIVRDVRRQLSAGDEAMTAFLDWFDRWFLRRPALSEQVL